MINIPDINDPLDNAATCIDWVKPQGKKNVAKPIIKGVKVLCSTLRKKLKRPAGSVTLFFAKIPTKFSPSISMITEARIPNIAVNVKLIPTTPPTAPSIPPRTAKLTILPTWKKVKFFLLILE